jgi:hypothetical protein
MFDLVTIIIGLLSFAILPIIGWKIYKRLKRERTEQILEEEEEKKLRTLETRFNDVLHELMNLLEK